MLNTVKLFILLAMFSASELSLGTEYRDFELSAYPRSNEDLADTIHDIIIDNNGYYWMSGSKGLQRYDGVRAKSILADKGELLYNKMVIWLGLADDELWFTTGDTLYNLDLNTYKTRSYRAQDNKENGLISNNIRKIYYSQRKELWFATQYGLTQYIAANDSFVNHHLPQSTDQQQTDINNAISTISEDQNGKFWLSTANNELWVFDSTLKTFMRPQKLLTGSGQEVSALQAKLLEQCTSNVSHTISRRNGNIGIFCSASYFEVDQNNLVSSHLNYTSSGDPLSIGAITEDLQSRIWLATIDNSIFRIDTNKNVVERNTAQSSFPPRPASTPISTLFTRPDGKIDITYIRNTTQTWSPSADDIRRIPIALKPQETLNTFNSHVLDDDHILLISNHGYLLKVNLSSEKQERIPAPKTTFDLFHQSNGDIWMASFDGIHKYDNNSQTLEKVLNNYAYEIHIPERSNTLWIKTRGGMSAFDLIEKKIKHYTVSSQGMLYNTRIIHSEQHGLWIIGDQQYHHYDPASDKFLAVDLPEAIRGVEGHNFFDGDDIITVNDNIIRSAISKNLNGHYIVEKASISNSRMEHSDTNVLHAQGNIWRSRKGHRQIYLYHEPTQTLRSLNRASGFPRQAGIQLVDYSKKHGLVIASATDISILKNPIAHTRPLDQKPVPSYAVIYEQHGLQRIVYNLQDGIHLNPGDNAFDIHFSNHDHSPLAQKVTAQYQLQGWDTSWIDSKESLIRYSGINPGLYQLLLANTNDKTLQSTLNVVVEAPIWRSQLAIAAYISSTLFLLALLLYYRWDKKRSDQAAQSLIRVYAKGYEKIGDGFCISDKNGEIRSFNRAFGDITGLKEDAENKSINQFKSPSNESGGYRYFWETLIEKDYWEGQLWLKNTAGTDIPLECKASTVVHEGTKHYILVVKDITQKLAHEAELKRMATFDDLTGLPNRCLLNEELKRTIASTRRRANGKFCLIFIDLDRFKFINDSLGHEVGDLLLIEMAKRLRESVREEDIIARLGGDEFIIVIDNLLKIEDVHICCDNILRRFRDAININGNDLFCNLSIGISSFPADGDDAKTLLKNADIAMYNSKARGGSAYSFYAKSMNDKLQNSLQLETEVRKAIANHEVQAYFQPKIDMQTREIIGFEALVRWKRNGREFPAKQFITMAENLGLIMELSLQVLHMACLQVKAIEEKFSIQLPVAINLSPKQLGESDFVDQIVRIVRSHDLPFSAIEFEITENMLMDDDELAIQKITALQLIGHKVSVDDFGIGYSSLAYLNRLPIDTIKIDREFTSHLLIDKGQQNIVQSIINLAHSLDKVTIAEGIETEETHELLQEMGCKLGQGYLYTKPISSHDLEKLLLNGLVLKKDNIVISAANLN